MLGLKLLQSYGARPSMTIIIKRCKSKRLGARNYPERLPSIKETAQRLGFEDAVEMYPAYPLEEPPELWMVTQIHKQRYRPYWEKEVMKDMGLYKRHDKSIQMNTTSVNEKLWQVKHLIKVQPIRFPQGYPTKDDIGGTLLKKNGEFIIFDRLESPDDADEDAIYPQAKLSEWKTVDGYRKCNNCKERRCYRLGMCQKIWLQRGCNYIESVGPRMYNFVDPEKEK